MIWSCGRGANNEEEVRKQRTADHTKRVVNLLGFPTLNHLISFAKVLVINKKLNGPKFGQ